MDLQTLMDRAYITDLIYLYCRGLDRRHESTLSSIYHEDAIEDRGEGIFIGLARDWVQQTLPVLEVFELTQHCVMNILIEIDGDTAHGESYFNAYHRFGEPPAKLVGNTLDLEWPIAGTEMILAGRYLDRFERRDGIWKIAHRRMVCDWSRTQPVADEWLQKNPAIHLGVPSIDNAKLAY